MQFVVNQDGSSAWSNSAKGSEQSATSSSTQINSNAPPKEKKADKAPKGKQEKPKPEPKVVVAKKEINTEELQKLILKTVNDEGMIADTADFCKKHGYTSEDIYPAINSLVSRNMLASDVIEIRVIELTDEGKSYAVNGSPEFQFVMAMKTGEKVDMAEMEGRVGQ